MKYLRYILIVILRYIGKVVGLLWIYVAIPFRKYARNTVYNYVLANGVHLPRLLERPIEYINGEFAKYYVIRPYHHTNGGYIKKRKVTAIEYYAVLYVLWIWLDDDSNEDTYSQGYCDTIRNKERLKWFPSKWLDSCKNVQYGNSFDLGDAREPAFCFWGMTLWNIRNTFQNYGYMFKELSEEDYKTKGFYIEKFGWKFGYNPYTVEKAKGRLVFEPI